MKMQRKTSEEAVKGGVTGACWEEMEADVETLKGERRFLKIKYFVFIARGFYFSVFTVVLVILNRTSLV